MGWYDRGSAARASNRLLATCQGVYAHQISALVLSARWATREGPTMASHSKSQPLDLRRKGRVKVRRSLHGTAACAAPALKSGQMLHLLCDGGQLCSRALADPAGSPHTG